MKNDIDSQLSSRIQAFARELQDLLRQQALAAVRSALGGSGRAASAPAVSQEPAKGASRPAKPSRKRRGRPGADLSALTEPILSMLRATPGQRADALARALGTTPKELKRPIDRLLADGAVRKEGKARATRYYVA